MLHPWERVGAAACCNRGGSASTAARPQRGPPPRPPARRRAIFTRRALDSTRLFSDTLLGTRTYAVDQLSSSVSWVTGLSVIIMSSIVGLCMLLSLLRTYQETARLPSTKCGAHPPRSGRAPAGFPALPCLARRAHTPSTCKASLHASVPRATRPARTRAPAHPHKHPTHAPKNPGPPGRVSYGGYVTLMTLITFGLWLMTVVVALLIAAQLSWLLLAFMFEAAMVHGVT